MSDPTSGRRMYVISASSLHEIFLFSRDRFLHSNVDGHNVWEYLYTSCFVQTSTSSEPLSPLFTAALICMQNNSRTSSDPAYYRRTSFSDVDAARFFRYLDSLSFALLVNIFRHAQEIDFEMVHPAIIQAIATEESRRLREGTLIKFSAEEKDADGI